MMQLKEKVIIGLFIYIILSCANKDIDKNLIEDTGINHTNIFFERNKKIPEMIYPVEYYQSKIMEFQKIIPERRRINVIHKIDNIIPGFLCFIVGWDDFNAGRGEGFDIIANAPPRGNFFGLYTFDENQNIINEYQVGFRNYLDSIRNILLEKVPGEKFEYGLISCGDFNNDGINEIASIHLHPPQYEYVFTVFGFDTAENNLVEKLFVPIYIHFEQPFPPVEHIGNGFRILEILDNSPLELVWNNYLWDINAQKYVNFSRL